jgi:hypothetical protein
MCDERDLDPALGQLDEAFALGGLRRSNGMFSLLHRTMTRSLSPTGVGGVETMTKGPDVKKAPHERPGNAGRNVTLVVCPRRAPGRIGKRVPSTNAVLSEPIILYSEEAAARNPRMATRGASA